MLSFDTLRASARGKITDIACPNCGQSCKTPSNRIRKVLRIWDDGGDFITYSCARCGESGWVRDDTGRSTPRRRMAPAKRVDHPAPDKSATARFLLERSRAGGGSLTEVYLRSRQCWDASLSVRYLEPQNGYPPAMIARFGLCGEITGVHITRLKPDGTDKAGTDKDKIMIGPSMGQPIVVYENPKRPELAICEGIEDAASIAVSAGLTCWAAGSAGRIAALMPATRNFEHVYVAADNDFAGKRALQLAREKRSDIIPLDFGELDANDTLLKHGADAILTAIAASIREAA